MDDSLLKKLKSLGVDLGTNIPQRNPFVKKGAKSRIEEVVDGEFIETEWGAIFSCSHDYPLDHIHGADSVAEIKNQGMMSCCLGIPEVAELDQSEYIYLDTETSGLSGGSGTLIFMVGLGYLKNGVFRIVQLFLDELEKEAGFLQVLDQQLSDFKAIVTFNGKSFDVPMINNRHILNRMPSPVKNMAHIDLLHVARGIWKNRLSSRTLGMLENEVLNFIREEEDIPGWLVPEIYADYLHDGDATPLKGVFYHNEMDILSLQVLHHHINNLLEEPFSYAGDEALDLMGIARIFERAGQVEKAVKLYEYSLAKEMPEEITIQGLMRYAMIYKRLEEWEKAIQIWNRLADYHRSDACIEIAKYYEHQLGDYQNAKAWSERALAENEFTKGKSRYEKERNIEEIRHRMERLEKRIQ